LGGIWTQQEMNAALKSCRATGWWLDASGAIHRKAADGDSANKVIQSLRNHSNQSDFVKHRVVSHAEGREELNEFWRRKRKTALSCSKHLYHYLVPDNLWVLLWEWCWNYSIQTFRPREWLIFFCYIFRNEQKFWVTKKQKMTMKMWTFERDYVIEVQKWKPLCSSLYCKWFVLEEFRHYIRIALTWQLFFIYNRLNLML
jgi:hypothetical protein